MAASLRRADGYWLKCTVCRRLCTGKLPARLCVALPGEFAREYRLPGLDCPADRLIQRTPNEACYDSRTVLTRIFRSNRCLSCSASGCLNGRDPTDPTPGGVRPMHEIALPPGVKVLSVSDLTANLRRLVEDAFPVVWVGGEVSNFKRHGSGHVYFTLKDTEAQIRAVVWRSTAWRVRFQVKDGLQVIACGRLSVFPPKGEY